MFLAAVVILASGCSASRGCQLCTAPSSPAGYAVIAGNADHAVTLRAGQKMEIVLRAAQGMNNWTQPKSSDASVLQPIVDPGATAAAGVTLAAFQAVVPGQVDVTSNGSPKCPAGQACPMFLAVWQLRVTVTS